jgi:hypothetical protein
VEMYYTPDSIGPDSNYEDTGMLIAAEE